MEGSRPATPEDVPRLAELCRAALAELAAQRRGGALYVVREARPEPVEDMLGALVVDGGAAVVTGTLDGVVVGYATGRVETLRTGERLGVIDDLFVEEGGRGVGVGEKMMADLMTFFTERQCVGIDAFALPGARATKNFFEASGFTARLLVMHHALVPPQPSEGGDERAT